MSDDLVKRLLEFNEMPLEGGSIDPLIEVFQGLAKEAVYEIGRLRGELFLKQDKIMCQEQWVKNAFAERDAAWNSAIDQMIEYLSRLAAYYKTPEHFQQNAKYLFIEEILAEARRIRALKKPE